MSDTVALRDVAHAAGVSVGTASNVWRRPDVVAAGTRRRVLDAAAALGFDGPNPIGQLLRTGAAHCVGVVVDQPLTKVFTDPYYLRLMEGVAAACAERGSGIALIAAHGAVDAPWSVRTALVDGFIVFSCGPDGAELVARCARRGLPIVGIDLEPADELVSIRIDDRAAARAVMGETLARGHRRIGIVSLHTDEGATGREALALPLRRETIERLRYVATRLRLHGYLDALESVPDARLVKLAVVPDDEPDWQALTPGLGELDAVVAMSDIVARELRRRLPEGVGVVGFDGLDTGDGLATLVQPVANKGRLAVGEIYAPSGARDHVLPTRFLDGASLGGE